MPTAIYKLFITYIKDAIYSQLKLIYKGLNSVVIFVQKVYLAYSTKIFFLIDNTLPSIKLKYKPDASFQYNNT